MLMRPLMFRGAVVGGVATTWNPADKAAGCTLSNGNLTATASSSTSVWGSARSTTSKSSGKFYFEAVINVKGTDIGTGISNQSSSLTSYTGNDANGVAYYSTGDVYMSGNLVASGPALSPGDIVSVAIDATGRLVWFAYNGGWIQGTPSSGSGGITAPSGLMFATAALLASARETANFGASGFAFAAPAGFSPWG